MAVGMGHIVLPPQRRHCPVVDLHKTRISCRWKKNPRDPLHHGERAANNKVDAECDKLATELS